jgi:hypothetical protein
MKSLERAASFSGTVNASLTAFQLSARHELRQVRYALAYLTQHADLINELLFCTSWFLDAILSKHSLCSKLNKAEQAEETYKQLSNIKLFTTP